MLTTFLISSLFLCLPGFLSAPDVEPGGAVPKQSQADQGQSAREPFVYDEVDAAISSYLTAKHNHDDALNAYETARQRLDEASADILRLEESEASRAAIQEQKAKTRELAVEAMDLDITRKEMWDRMIDKTPGLRPLLAKAVANTDDGDPRKARYRSLLDEVAALEGEIRLPTLPKNLDELLPPDFPHGLSPLEKLRLVQSLQRQYDHFGACLELSVKAREKIEIDKDVLLDIDAFDEKAEQKYIESVSQLYTYEFECKSQHSWVAERLADLGYPAIESVEPAQSVNNDGMEIAQQSTVANNDNSVLDKASRLLKEPLLYVLIGVIFSIAAVLYFKGSFRSFKGSSGTSL
ncbi:MAG: hypothetical protein NUW37_11445 [Planctomycetes bacterium]|nr:hypothetical protein [Planctomycetota bacterium]